MAFELTTELRDRLVEDMLIRGYSDGTRKDYLRVVEDFTGFLGGPPDFADVEDLRRYQLHLAVGGASPAKMNACVSALRFFFRVTLGRAGLGERLARVRQEDRLPEVLSPEEVALLLHCVPNLKHRLILSIAYGCGLRVSEIVRLKVVDIDSLRMVIRIEQGIRLRQGQPKFRSRLLTAYGRACAFTGERTLWVLEAAHIVPYLGPKTNHVTNGLLLRSDVHTLFDLGLVAVHPASRTLRVARRLESTPYEALKGQPLREPRLASNRASQAALEAHFATFEDN